MMSWNAYINGWKTSFSYWKLGLLLFSVLLILTMVMTSIFGDTLQMLFGNSLIISEWLSGFDYNSFSDILNTRGSALGTFTITLKWGILFYLLITIFIDGGILHLLSTSQKFSRLSFLDGCSTYFRKLLVLAAIHLFLVGIVFGVVFYAFQVYVGGFSPFEIESDARITTGMQWFGALFIVFFFISRLVFDLSKVILIKEQRSILASIRESFKWIFRHFFKYLLLYLLGFGSFVALYFFFTAIQHFLGDTSNISLLLSFLFAQLFAFIRSLFKMYNYASLYALHKMTI